MHRIRAIAASPLAVSAAAAVVIGLLAASLPAAAAGQPPAGQSGAAGQLTTGRDIDHFNVAAAHSPQFERMLTGGVARPPKAASSSVPGPTASGQPPVQGIDISSAQHPGGAAINWADVASDGYKFAFVKVSEGSYYTNPYYHSDSANAQAAGLFVAPYIFAVPNYSGGALQADYGLDAAEYTSGGKILTPILDIEDDPYKSEDGTNDCYGLKAAQMVAWIRAFVTEIHRRTGDLPAFYTSAGWWKECTGDSTAFTGDPLWIVDVNDSSAPSLPAAWSTWTYWQYASDASVPGITSPGGVDVDYMNPSALELAAPATQSDAEGIAPANVTASALDGSSTTEATFSAAGLPTGMSTDPTTGVISGTLPSSTGTFRVNVTATAGTATSTQAFTWYVHGAVSLGSLRRRTGSVGAPALVQVAAPDGLAGCTLRFSASGLPSGLSMNSCGLISGWLQASGRYTVTVRVTDSSGAALAASSFSWTVNAPGKSGLAGRIQLVRDGKCLTALSKTDIAIEPCAAGKTGRASAQHWTVAANGAIRLRAECLSVRGAKKGKPASLDLVSCPGGGQRWQIRSNAVLESLTDFRCLTETGKKNGSRAAAEPCSASYNNTGSASTPSTNQQWLAPAGLVSGITPYCGSDWHSATAKIGLITLRVCGGRTATQWTVEPNGALKATGKCLGLSKGKTAPGTAVRLVSCGHSAQQVWQLTGGPTGRELLNPASGLCLADPGDRAEAGRVLAIEPCVAGDPGVWWGVS
jgi:GH25 family lysozyme M1 (1,4-beta-N-acetylmuramidase)